MEGSSENSQLPTIKEISSIEDVEVSLQKLLFVDITLFKSDSLELFVTFVSRYSYLLGIASKESMVSSKIIGCVFLLSNLVLSLKKQFSYDSTVLNDFIEGRYIEQEVNTQFTVSGSAPDFSQHFSFIHSIGVFNGLSIRNISRICIEIASKYHENPINTERMFPLFVFQSDVSKQTDYNALVSEIPKFEHSLAIMAIICMMEQLMVNSNRIHIPNSLLISIIDSVIKGSLALADMSRILCYYYPSKQFYNIEDILRSDSDNSLILFLLYLNYVPTFPQGIVNLPELNNNFKVAFQFYKAFDETAGLSPDRFLHQFVSSQLYITKYVFSNVMGVDPELYNLCFKDPTFQESLKLIKNPNSYPYLCAEKYPIHKCILIATGKHDPVFDPDGLSFETLVSLFFAYQNDLPIDKNIIFQIITKVFQKLELIIDEFECDNQIILNLLKIGFCHPCVEKNDITEPPNSIEDIFCEKSNDILYLMNTLAFFSIRLYSIEEAKTNDIFKNELSKRINFPFIYTYNTTLFKSVLSESQIKEANISQLDSLKSMFESSIIENDLVQNIGFLWGKKETAFAILEKLLLSDNGIATFLNLPETNIQFLTEFGSPSDRIGIVRALIKNKCVSFLSSHVLKIYSSLDNPGKEGFCEMIGFLSVKFSESVYSIIQQFTQPIDYMNAFIRSIPIFQEEVSESFLNIIMNILSHNQQNTITLCIGSVHKKQLEISWNDDISVKNSTEKINIWLPIDSLPSCPQEKCETNTPMFKCYTCGNPDQFYCIECSMKYHREHDLLFCNPYSPPKCCQKCIKSVTDEKKEGSSQSVSCIIEPLQMIKLFGNMCPFIKRNEPPVIESPIVDIKSIDIKTLKTKVSSIPPLVFQSYDLVGVDIPDSAVFSNFFTKSKEPIELIKRRNQVSHFQTISFAGQSSEFLIMAQGCDIYSKNIDTNGPINSVSVPKPVYKIVVSKNDPMYFAVASLKKVFVYKISNDGKMEIVCEVQLVLDAIGRHIFVNSIYWLPNKPLHLAVVCNSFVKVYDILVDFMAPSVYFEAPSPNEFITSATIVSYEGDSYGIFGIAGGKLAYQKMQKIEQDPPIFQNVFSVSNLAEHPIVSYCENTNIFFVTSQSQTMFISRLEDVMAKFETISPFIRIRTKFELLCLCNHPQHPNIHIMVHPNSGCLFTLDFGETHVSSYQLNSKPIERAIIPLLENKMLLISSMSYKQSVYSISPAGKVFELVLNSKSSKKADFALDPSGPSIDNEEEEEYEEDHFKVPPSFWYTAKIEKNGIKVFYPSNGESTNCILEFNRYVFDNSTKKKIVEISSTNPNNLIVGFNIFVGSNSECHRPPWISLRGRKIITNGQRGYSIALKPEEVGYGETYRIRLGNNGGYDINFDGIEVFTMQYNIIEKFIGKNGNKGLWRLNRQSLINFSDENNPNGVLDQIAMSVVPKTFQIEKDECELLVRIMYKYPNASLPSRSMITRLTKEENLTEQYWSEAAYKCFVENEIHPNLSDYFWEDFPYFTEEFQKKISTAMFSMNTEAKGENAIIAAFLSS